MEGAMWQLVALLWLAWAGPLPVRAKYVEGELSTGENWSFLARFCFLSLSGMFEYDIEYPEVGIFSILCWICIPYILPRT
jgi:hypothetical protein